jgi:hypothetical protein
MHRDANNIVEKIRSLSSEQLAEVEEFVEFIRLRGQERNLTRAASAISESAFAVVWNNSEDEVYDAL